MKINIDFRLLDVSLELDALHEQYELIEKQIEHITQEEKKALDDYRRTNNITPEYGEWDISRQEYEHKVEFLLPRIFWSSFIVSLYAVFETSVIEIAGLIQKNLKQGLSINDLRGNFLKRAKKYYSNVINFELHNDDKAWQRINILTDVRHIIAHANGRTDMVNDDIKKNLKELEKKNIGISSFYNYLLIDSIFAKDTLTSVSSMLKNLVERYKEWDTNQKKA